MKLRKSYYGLKFGSIMQFTMKRIIVCNGHTQLIFAFLISAGWGCCRYLNVLYMNDDWMELGCNLGDLDGGETSPGWVLTQMFGRGFRWDATWDGGETWIWGPGWSWELSWMEVRCKSLRLNGGEMVHNLNGEETGILEPRWSLHANLETWMVVEMRPGFS